jgi:capsid protein
VLESEFTAMTDDDAEVVPFKRVPINKGMQTTLPAGMKMHQFDPKQPATTYEMFQEKCLGEACRPLSYPLNLALGTSQKFNFSSAKLDHLNYRKSLTVERKRCEIAVLNRLFKAWFDEAVMVPGLLPRNASFEETTFEWHWPGFEPLEAVADATADHDRLSHGTLTFQEFWAKRGRDWRDVMAQQSAELSEIERLQLDFGEPIKRTITETTTADAGEGAALVA